MKIRQQSLLLAIIGLVVGLPAGYFYVDYYNRVGPTAGSPTGQPTGGQMPPDHPAISSVSPEQMASAKQTAERNQNDFNAQMTAARLLYQANQLTEAAEFFQRAHQLQPDNYEAIVQLGNTNFDIGLQEFQSQNPGHSTEHFLEAARWYERALEMNPNEVNVRTDYGLTYYYRHPQDLDRAIAQYRRSLEIQPTHPQTLSNLATALVEKGHIREAKDIVAKLEQSSPDQGLLGQTLYNFTRAMMEQENWEEAELTLARLEQLFPNVPEVTRLRQDLDARRGTRIQPH